MSLGEMIYKLRTEKNLSQGDLAEKLNVSRQSISKWENNSAVPDLDKIIKLSDIFEVSLDELVKGEEKVKEVLSEVKTEVVYEKQTNFPPRKIAGIILLCMAFFVTMLFLFAGASLAGLIFASPFLVCGIICFSFKKNVGLWCSWAVYVLFDIYMAFATGISRSNVLLTLMWTREMNYIRLALAWVLMISLFILIMITVIRVGKCPIGNEQKNKKKLLISWLVVLAIQIIAMIWPRTGLYGYILANILSMATVYSMVTIVLSWVRIVAVTVALIYTVRFLCRKK